jgi:hypothetical protein
MVSSVCPRVVTGQYEPEYMGWWPNPDTEAKEQIPAPLVSFAIKAASGRIVTLLYPSPDDECPITNVALTEGGFEIFFGDESECFSLDDERFAADTL